MWSPPACFASSSSESLSSSAGLLSESLLSSLGSGSDWVSSMSKMWMLVSDCRNLGNPVSESCAIWCQTLLYRHTGMAYLFTTLLSLSQNS